MHLVVAACDVVVAERVVQLTVVDEVDAAGRRANLVGVLPVHLLLEDIGVRVLQVDRLFRFLGDPAKEAGIQIQNCLTAPII